jgi:hypothetical protein
MILVAARAAEAYLFPKPPAVFFSGTLIASDAVVNLV